MNRTHSFGVAGVRGKTSASASLDSLREKAREEESEKDYDTHSH
jgi:hypothetical protein